MHDALRTTRGTARRWFGLMCGVLYAFVLCAPLHAARPGVVQPPLGTDAMRRLALDQPQAMIDQAHRRLKAGDGKLTPAAERGLLWWMGSAALNLSDDATLTEAVLRLDGLHHVRHDALAGAAAGYLRAFHEILNGDPSGLSTALRAAALVQDSPDPRVLAWSDYELCDAYTQVGDAAKAQPICRKAEHQARAVGDDWERADDENDLAWNDSALHKYPQAIALYKRSRARFTAIGARQVAAQVGDNLAHTLILTGHPRQALQLSRASLVHEQSAGRENDALLSRANIARAYAALHQPRRAEQVIHAAIEEARKTSNHGLLPKFYAADSRYAEAAGDMQRALDSARKVGQLLENQRRPGVLATEKILEDRYAARERELRIRNLERENRIKAMQLQVAKVHGAQEAEARRREQLWNVVIMVLVASLLVIVWLLYLLLRAQRRHAQALRLLSLYDPLTGVENRRAFMQAAGLRVEAMQQGLGRHDALLLIDLDHFKQVNDSDGHPAGDRVLVRLVKEIEQVAGEAGKLSRLGGEEFALLCPGMDAPGAERLAHAICRHVAAMPLPLPDGSNIQRITVSIGVAILDGQACHDIETWMRAADHALYEAKDAGRNCVVMAH